jgi:hypothetical protein
MEKHKIEAELNAVLKSGCISTIFSVKLVIWNVGLWRGWL